MSGEWRFDELAKLVYTRGSVIACQIELKEDPNAFSVDLNPRAICKVYLRRIVTFLDPAGRSSGKKQRSDNTLSFEGNVSSVIWYNIERREGMLVARGEIHVHDGLPVSVSHPAFSVEVRIVLNSCGVY